MTQRSAGLLLYRRARDGVEVLLVHLGGPYWTLKEEGAWSVPKGEHDESEDPLEVAMREFSEELGTEPARRECCRVPRRAPSAERQTRDRLGA